MTIFTQPPQHQPSSQPASVPLTRSRKRPLSSADAPTSKRHLNTALAAELQTLRISPPAPLPINPAQSVFGPTLPQSPFLSPSRRSTSPSSAPLDMSFGTDFVSSLAATVSEPFKPGSPATTPAEVSSPTSSASSGLEMLDVTAPDTDDLIIEDVSEDEVLLPPPPENRLVLYKPPVRSSASAVASLNACLPHGHYAFRNPRTHDWFVSEPSESTKRKLAVVPWRGDAKKQFSDPSLRSPTVIRMPWKDTPIEEQVPPVEMMSPLQTDVLPTSSPSGSTMDIEEIA